MKFGSITTPIITDGLVLNMDAANRASVMPPMLILLITHINLIQLLEWLTLDAEMVLVLIVPMVVLWVFDGT